MAGDRSVTTPQAHSCPGQGRTAQEEHRRERQQHATVEPRADERGMGRLVRGALRVTVRGVPRWDVTGGGAGGVVAVSVSASASVAVAVAIAASVTVAASVIVRRRVVGI